MLTTISEKIEFNEEFNKFFQLYAGEINPIINNSEVKNIDDWAVWIDPNTIQKSEELDDDSSFNTFIMTSFYVQNLVTKESIEIRSLEEREMFLTEDCLELMRKGKGYIKFKDMEESTTLFELSIMNNELTKPLYNMINLLNSNTGKTNYHEMCQEFVELLVDAGIGAMAISGEVIINRMIRKDPDDDFERPDFSEDDIGPYKIITILKALENNKSALVGISSQNLKKQILSDDIVTKKTGTSYLDIHFKKEISTERLKELHALTETM